MLYRVHPYVCDHNMKVKILNKICTIKYVAFEMRGRHDRMVVGFITTYVISAFHHKSCSFEYCLGKVYLIQHYVIKLYKKNGNLSLVLISKHCI